MSFRLPATATVSAEKPQRAVGAGEHRAIARRGTLILATLAASTLAVLALAPVAFAAKKYVFVRQFPPPYPENENWNPSYFSGLLAQSVAVSDKNHHIYVADSGRGAIYDLKSATDNAPARWNGTNTPKGSFGESFLSVAVDNTTGDVYVADRPHAVIDKFDENGNLIESFGDTETKHNGQLVGLETPAKSFSPPTEYYTSFPIAVDQANHDLYVADPGHKAIDIFDENGKYLKQITATPAGLYGEGGARTTGIAVTTAGNVYVADWAAHEIFQFNSAGEYVSTWNGGTLPNGAASETPEGTFGYDGQPLEVAAEDATGHVFVNNWGHSTIDIFDANGNFLPPLISRSEFSESILYGIEGVEIDQATGYLYASPNGGSVQIFKPVIVPNVAVKPASGLLATTATISGHVDPAAGEGGGPITSCYFEYLSTFDVNEGRPEGVEGEPPSWQGAKLVPCSPEPSASPTDVSATLTGLKPATQYRFRLVVANAEGENRAIGPAFATAGPYGFSTYLGSAGSGAGQLKEPTDVAVDNSNGDIYVADTGNHRIVKLDPSGKSLAAWGWGVANGNPESEVCTSVCQAGLSGSGAGQFASPRFVAVDDSGGPSAHDVYVTDTADDLVQKFDENGKLIASWASGGAIDFTKAGKIGGITVDPFGNLFVLTTTRESYFWTEIAQDGVSRRKFSSSELELGYPNGAGIEVDSIGGFYETQQREGGGVRYNNPRAYAYSGHMMYPPSYRNELVNSGLVVDRSTNDLYVDQGNHIDRFPSAAPGCHYGAYGSVGQVKCAAQTFGLGNLSSASGLAFNPSSHLLYAANTGANDVAVFSRSSDPVANTGPVTSPAATYGTLTGNVEASAGGSEATDCSFEYLEARAITDAYQNVTVAAATGTGNLAEGSTEVTGFTTSRGKFEVGDKIAGPGIPGGTIVTSVEPGKLEISNPADKTSTGAALIKKPTGGYFTLSFEGVTISPPFPFNAETYTIKIRLERLVTVHLGSLVVFGSDPYTIRFTDSLGETDVPQLTASPGSLEPAGTTVTVTTATHGFGWGSASKIPCSPAAPFSFPTAVSANLTGLVPFTTYDYRLTATGPNGLTSYGQIHSFTPTQGEAPVVAATSSSEVTPTAATLSAQINPRLAPTIYRFQYGTDTTYGSETPPSGTIGEDTVSHSVSSEISGLRSGTTYHFRVLATNLNGTTAGPDRTFNSTDLPAIGEVTASAISPTTATLSAQVKPGFSPTTYSFQYGPTRAYGSSTGGSVSSDNSIHVASNGIAGLTPATTYHYRVRASNAIGTAVSSDKTFTTAAPTVTPPRENEPPKCRRGFVRRHGKCVRKRSNHKRRHHNHRRRHHKRGSGLG